MQGSIVVYDVVVTNEGTLDAFAVEVSDNIPTGLILNDANWTEVGGGVATLNTPIVSIQAGGSETVSIEFTIDPMFMGSQIVNIAEITGANDVNGDAGNDVDSDPTTGSDVDEDGDNNGDDDDEDALMCK